jgi:L-amino acid N-acyltransferase YncA
VRSERPWSRAAVVTPYAVLDLVIPIPVLALAVAQRRGIGTEAARALVGWLGRQPARTVIAHIHPGHHASAAFAPACGFPPTSEYHDGELRWRLETESWPEA